MSFNYKNKNVYLISESGEEKLIVENLKVANNFFTRFKGLMGTKNIEEKTGLLIYPCNEIHMFFMKYPIDIIYLDKNLNILKITKSLNPWKIDSFVKKCYFVLEIKANTIDDNKYVKINIK